MVAMGEMIGNIAHQWRQPLSLISSASSSIKLEKELNILSDDKLIKTIDKITFTAHHMSKTIDDFRDFLKGDDKKTYFNLAKEIDKCLAIEEGILKQNSINVIKSLDDTINLNNLPHGLSQSLVNIINNAKDIMVETMDKYSRFLFIEAKKETDKVVITLKDSGGGIPEDIIGKVFEPYFTTKHQSQGTGLGLHMAYKIITENMNGSIIVSNETYTFNDNEYTGAKFTITLPVT